MDALTELLGTSAAFEVVKARARRLLDGMRDAHRAPLVLIEGETGTGKGQLARALHHSSSRAAGPFVPVNCAAIPETLAESELFGFEAGAHSEARRARAGLFQSASGGTIFLDEVGLLPDAIQRKLLKVVEDRRVRRVGGTHDSPIDVWIISATNAELLADVHARRFRADLYQRLAVVRFVLPPLRERGDDTEALAEAFIGRSCADYGLPRKRLAPEARLRLRRHPWPGNIRELANVIERAVLLGEGEVIKAQDLELEPAPSPARASEADDPGGVRDRHLLALERTKWNISRAAAELGISRKTLRARIERLGLRGAREGEPATLDQPLGVSFALGVHSTSGGTDALLARPPGGALGQEPDVVDAPSSRSRSAVSGSDLGVAQPGPLRWERRRVTLLRVDLALSPDVDTVSSGHASLTEVLEKAQMFGGRLEGLSTTWATMSFGAAPLDESPSRAAHAALAIQRAAARWIQDDAHHPSLKVAVDIDSMLVAHDRRTVEIDRDGFHALDQQLAGLAARCEAGWIGVGSQIGPFLERRFHLVRIEAHPFAPGPTYRLLGPKAPGQDETRTPSPFVGREPEVALLMNRLDPVRHGHGQIVAVVGEAGVGKSRLAAEFCRALAGTDISVLRTGPLHPAGPSLLPAIELLRRHLQIEERDGEAELRTKVARALPGTSPPPTWCVTALTELLGIPAADPAWAALASAERREQTLEALRRVFLAESQRAPLVLLFEDLHWVDSETQALIDKLAETAPAARMLLLLTYRPEYRLQWERPGHYSELWLEPLTWKEATELLHSLIGDDQAAAGLLDRLIEWTEGNPFFLEEAVRYLAAAGVLTGEPGRYLLARGQAELQIPPTVEDILAERIDRLAPETRGILEYAAVVGRKASWSILAAVVDQPAERLEAELRTLQAIGLLVPTGAPPDRQYRFKHQLTHQVVYGRLLPDRRRALHEAIFRHLEAAPPAAPQGDPVAELAFHAFHGGVWERALVWCRRAGERAHWRSSNPEASDYFRQARTCLEHLPQTPDRLAEAIDVLFGLRWALWPQGRLAEVGAALQEADELAAKLGDLRRQGMIAAYLADYFWATADNAGALAAGLRALTTAERVEDEMLAAQARFGLGLARAAVGQYREAANIVAEAVGAITGGPSEQGWRVIVMANGYLARYLAELGEFAGGLAAARSGMQAAESTNDAYSLLGSLLGSGTVHLRRGDFRTAVEVLARGLEIARVRGHVNWVPSLASSLGLSKVLGGQVSEGLELLTHALAAAERSGIPASQPLWMAYAAEGHVVAGRAGVGQSLAERALHVARSRGERGHEAWALRALGKALAHLGVDDLAAAPEVMRQAGTLAEALGMQPLLARCKSDLAEILDLCGYTREAAEARAEATALKAVLGMP